MSNMDDAVAREGRYLRSLSRKDAIEYIAWRYRRTREVHMAHNMTDIEIDQVAIRQYEELIKND